jgi:hypothetical protein
MRLPHMDTAKLSLVRQPFNHPDFLFELKHDGFRALAYISEDRCELVSRRRNPYKSFEQLRSNLAGLRVNDAILDGEIVWIQKGVTSLCQRKLVVSRLPALVPGYEDNKHFPVTSGAMVAAAFFLESSRL